MVERDVRRGGEQPREHGPVHDPNAPAQTPEFQERNREDVLGVLGGICEPAPVPEDTVPVAVEQATEGLTATGEDEFPVSPVVCLARHIP